MVPYSAYAIFDGFYEAAGAKGSSEPLLASF